MPTASAPTASPPAGTTLLSGLSGGGYTSALLSLGLNGTAQRDFWKLIISRCTQASDGCAGSLNGHMEDLVADALPEDAADKGGAGQGGGQRAATDARARTGRRRRRMPDACCSPLPRLRPVPQPTQSTA